MKTEHLIKPVCALLLAMATGCTPFTKIDGDSGTHSKLEGSWTVLYVGGEKLAGVLPPPIVVIDAAKGRITGYDGCNRYSGTYTFDAGRLKAQVASTRMACRGDAAHRVSRQLMNLFNNGAEVVEVAAGEGRVLQFKNAEADLRLGPTAVLEKK